MLGSWSKEAGAQLYCIEPSGTGYGTRTRIYILMAVTNLKIHFLIANLNTSSGYWGCAAGKAKSAAKTELEKIKMADMTCEELIKEAAKIIYQVSKDDVCTR